MLWVLNKCGCITYVWNLLLTWKRRHLSCVSKKFLALELVLDVLVDQGVINLVCTPEDSLFLFLAAGVEDLSFKKYFI